MTTSAENNKRIAKNTLLLYFRMLLTMVVSLYTSRIVLQALGVDDFGIYNVVGGVVAMFNVLSGSLSSAISRFITFELGKNDSEKLKRVFSTSLTIQIILAVIIAVVAEIVGIWFINEKMNIAAERLNAANWVFHFSVLTFIVNLLSVPYNAVIIAHERMSAFAYISILEVICKLLIAYLIIISPIDKLIFYSVLMAFVAILIRFVYLLYCKQKFVECRYNFIWDRILIKQMFGFAGWSFIGSSSSILRDQGGNIILNIFYGTTVNAARGIANQVYVAIYSFVTNFMTALNPQITKSYAVGDYEYTLKLIYAGSRYSSYLLFLVSLPIFINTEYLLSLWLYNYPDYTVQFVRLVLIFALSESISGPLITGQLATGKIRNYQLFVGGIQMMNLPVSYLFLYSGYPPESIFIIAICLSQCCLFARLYMLHRILFFSLKAYIIKVYLNIWVVIILSAILPTIVFYFDFKQFNSLPFIFTFLSLVVALLVIVFVGCSSKERSYVVEKLLRKIVRKV